MARPMLAWQYTYEDIADLLGIELSTVRKSASRGDFDPCDLKSIMLYAAANAEESFRMELTLAAARLGRYSVGKPPRKSATKRKEKS
ncbi:hypothetical protein [Novipirellula sp.]|uniref:hypothetical protein n=1 Tax=Novipirellula sp. TaxID=2795430 RepID=UPI0035687DCC